MINITYYQLECDDNNILFIVLTVEESTSYIRPSDVGHCRLRLFSDDILEGSTGS